MPILKMFIQALAIVALAPLIQGFIMVQGPSAKPSGACALAALSDTVQAVVQGPGHRPHRVLDH